MSYGTPASIRLREGNGGGEDDPSASLRIRERWELGSLEMPLEVGVFLEPFNGGISMVR